VLLAGALTAAASGISLIRIKPGDTLSALAVRYHTTVSRLVALNDLPGDGSLIYAGRMLKVPGGSGGGSTSSSGSHYTVSHYVVSRGDSLYAIAHRFHASADHIARLNHLPSSRIVILGQRLAIPHHVQAATSSPAPSQGGSGTPAALRDRTVLAHHAEPSREQTAAMIRATAARWGLDPRLALAISWQESGWNMNRVSGVDAIGAMQIMPYTGTYLSTYVVHRHLDLYNAQDNVTAGVALLSVLMRESHSESMSAAGYYQGLASVRSHGMYAATKQYVADVMALRQRF
jgi:LysM repeat protein